MPKPPANASFEQFERACRFTTYALESHPDTPARAPLMANELARLEALMAEDKQADIAIVRARVALGFADVRLDGVIRSIGVAARLDESQSATLKLIGLLFGNKTPSEVTRPTGSGMNREIADAVGIKDAIALIPAGQGQAVRNLEPELTAAITSAQASYAQFTGALQAKWTVRRKSPVLKQEIRATFDRIEGQLQDQFPGQRDLVASFFLPPDLSRDEAAEDPETPQDPPAPPSAPAAQGTK